MTFIFYGTPKESALSLEILKSHGYIPSLIVTAPDRPSGRGLQMTESPVSVWAKENHIPIFKPESLKNEEAILKIGSIQPDLAIVFAYGKIIPKSLLALPKNGTLNIHPSLLPLFRGSSPVESTVLSGIKETGVSIMVLDEEMDHGPIIAQERMDIRSDETASDLLVRLVHSGTEKLSQILPDFLNGKIKIIEQNHNLATYTKKVSKADGEILLSENSLDLYRKYRAYADWPGIYFFEDEMNKKHRVNIKKAMLKDGVFYLLRVTPEGKKEIDYADYQRKKGK